jgi:hypothetical protein
MKLPEDGSKCGSKHVAVIKQNKCKQFDWFIIIVALTAITPRIMKHKRVQTVKKQYLWYVKGPYLWPATLFVRIIQSW